jgi:branched-chain amino acid transport system permease protein
VGRAALRLMVAAVLALLAVLGLASVAYAADGEVRGRLVNAGQPLSDVALTATAPGEEAQSTTSDEDGRWEFALPEGTWTIALDEATLPDDVSIREGTPTEREVEVDAGLPSQVTFFFGEGGTGRGSSVDRAAQLAAEGLRFGLIIALAAVGLSLIFGTTGLTNFAHGEIVTGGALIAWFLNVLVGLQFIIAAALATVIMGLVGALADKGIWRPLRRRGTGLIAAMIVSIGLAILLRYFYLYLFGGAVRPFNDVSGQAGIPFGPITLTPADYFSMALATVVLIATGFALLKTRIGKATRAVSDNPALAAASGIDVDRVINVVWIAGAALAGLAGILLGISQQVSFQMGFQILLLVFAAVTLGGLGTAFGALVGSLIVGVLIQVSTLVIPPELKNVGALAVLIIVLLVRPNGILGRRERVG